MAGSLAKIALIPLLLAVSPAVGAPVSDAPGTGMPPPASGSSAAVPPGKVMLPPLPLAEMPDTRMPKEPDLAPLPGTGAPRRPAHDKSGGS